MRQVYLSCQPRGHAHSPARRSTRPDVSVVGVSGVDRPYPLAEAGAGKFGKGTAGEASLIDIECACSRFASPASAIARMLNWPKVVLSKSSPGSKGASQVTYFTCTNVLS